MRLRFNLICVLAFAFLIIPSVTLAATVNAKICFLYGVDYDDATIGDRFIAGTDETAFGVYAEITNGGTPVWSGYTVADGANAGCINTVTLDRSKYYQIKVYAKAYLDDDNEVKVFHIDDNGTPSDPADDSDLLHAQLVALVFKPSTGDAFSFDYDYLSTYDTSNILAATSKALDFRPGGISSHLFKYYTVGCEYPDDWESGSCNKPIGTFLDDNGRRSKYAIIHESGHEITRTVSPSGHTDDCTYNGAGHSVMGMEYQSCAAYEGFASFYAAAIWNYDTEDDCKTIYGHDCVDSGGRLGYFSPPYSGMGVENDWTTFWWWMYAAYKYGEMTVADIVQVYADSDMDSWGSGSSNTVWDDILSSAFYLGFTTDNWYTASGMCMVYY